MSCKGHLTQKDVLLQPAEVLSESSGFFFFKKLNFSTWATIQVDALPRAKKISVYSFLLTLVRQLMFVLKSESFSPLPCKKSCCD